MENIILSGFIAALFLLALKYWRFTLAFLVTVALAVSCSAAHAATITNSRELGGLLGLLVGGIVVLFCTAIVSDLPRRVAILFFSLVLFLLGVFAGTVTEADTPLRFEVSAIVESDEYRSTAQDATDYAARIFKDQLGVDLVVTYVDVNTVAGHTNAQALLDAVKLYRVEHTPHRAADVTVLFTRRELRGHAGIATIGPACSAQAAAVVAIRNDGYDGQILAHELLHTVGVPHDHADGWLMSESVSRMGADTLSPDSVLTFQGAGVDDCMAVRPVVTAAPVAASQPPGGGGGGSTGATFVAVLCALVALRQWFRAERRDEAAAHWLRKYRELRRLTGASTTH